MEVIRLQKTKIKSALVGVLLLLMCTSTYTLEDSQEQPCPLGDYRSTNGTCCNKCHPGFKLVEECQVKGQRSKCEKCPEKQFMAEVNHYRNCFTCRTCKPKDDKIYESRCEPHKDAVCTCKTGYYKSKIDSIKFHCSKCSACKPDEKEQQACTQERNTVCGCKENHYRENNVCVPCTNCSEECSHHCPTRPFTGPNPHDTQTKLLISGVVVCVLSVVAGIFISYLVTKRNLNNRKQISSSTSQPSDFSTNEPLVVNIEPNKESYLNAVPQNPVCEQGLSNLPDCVPLEVKLHELIYIVLDNIPVLRVKELARSLGVSDTEIEQAEVDYRQCREAHYQMLKVWAKNGSHAGGGVMLHRPLLGELLDKLRQMHLGSTAEVLEAKYGIQ